MGPSRAGYRGSNAFRTRVTGAAVPPHDLPGYLAGCPSPSGKMVEDQGGSTGSVGLGGREGDQADTLTQSTRHASPLNTPVLSCQEGRVLMKPAAVAMAVCSLFVPVLVLAADDANPTCDPCVDVEGTIYPGPGVADDQCHHRR